MKIKEITGKKLWEKFINEYSPQSFFQSWNWGETVGIQNLWRLGLYDKDELIGIAQLQKVTARRGTFLHIRHGPIFKSWNKKYVSFLLDYLRDLNKAHGASFIRVSPLIKNSPENKYLFKSLGFIDSPIHAQDAELCWVLDLDKDEQTLFSEMRKTTRYLIRQAQKLGVEIVKSRSKKDLDDFFGLYTQTAARQHFVKHKGIVEEFDKLIGDDQILLLKGYYEKKLLAAALIVFYNHQAIYHHSASVGQKIPVNYLLQWEAIKEAKKRLKKVYNFWGIAKEEKRRHPWRGLTLFKTGFGGKIIEYMHAQDLPFSLLYCTTYIVEWLRKTWKGY